MKICFDMDGTIADLYSVENWLDYLVNKNEYPYKSAKVLVNMNILARYLNRLQENGFKIGIISWLSKNSDNDYDERVTKAKEKWLAKHLKSVSFDFVEIVKYGFAKETFCSSDKDILFDDEENNRNNWTGKAFSEKDIFKVLKELLKESR